MNWRRARHLAWALLAVSLGFGILGEALHLRVLSGVGVVTLIAMAVVELAFDRCPHCRAFIGRGENRYCSVCGKSLEE